MSMTEREKINGWTFEETVKTAENLMEEEQNMFKWDVLRHLRDFAETYKEEVQQLHAIGTVSEFRELKEKATERYSEEDAPDGYGHTCTNKTCAERIRAKAIEEFAERLKKHKFHSKERFENCVPVCQIDWIAKELKGE